MIINDTSYYNVAIIDQIESNIPQQRVNSSSRGGGTLPVVMNTESNEVFIQGIIMIYYNICVIRV